MVICKEKTMSSRKTVGLALGSGSSSGWAHIGAIEALEEENIPIDYVAGSSVGSYVGALYASGSLRSLKEFVLRMDGKKVVLKSGNIGVKEKIEDIKKLLESA